MSDSFWIAVTSSEKTERATISEKTERVTIKKDARPDYYGDEDGGSGRCFARCHRLDGRDEESQGGSSVLSV